MAIPQRIVTRLLRSVTLVLRGLRGLLMLVFGFFRPLLLPVIGGLLAYFLVPIALSRYNDVRSLREARLTRAIHFGDRNAEFVSKIHREDTLLRMFAAHNDRMNISGTELKKARRDLSENYRNQYLEIDATEWWWPWEFKREVRALNLLSSDELTQLDKYLHEYSDSAKLTIYQPIYLWEYLDSPKYKIGRKKSKSEITKIEGRINDISGPEYEKRAELVEKIAALFAQSNYRTGWRDIVGL